MRVIKFRVWDLTYKIYIPKEVYDIHSLTSFNSFGVMRKEWNTYVTGEYFYERSQILEQFTGLQDKNGVDIYEGDLLEIHNNKNGLLKVEFKNEYVGGWVLSHETVCNHLSLGARKSINLEVIGNIHKTK